MVIRVRQFILIALCILAFGGKASAFPLKFIMTIDTKFYGKAVLSGDVHAFVGAVGGGSKKISATLPGGGAPVNWTIEAGFNFFKSGSKNILNFDSLQARHITDPAPHVGESSPGPPLNYHGSGPGTVAWFDLDGEDGGTVAKGFPLTGTVVQDHDGHPDTMEVGLRDLVPIADRVLDDGEIRMTAVMWHAPEGDSIVLLLAGGVPMLGCIAFRRNRRSKQAH